MHAFTFLKPQLDWLERAWAAAPTGDLSPADRQGWRKLDATVELVHAAEASVRRRQHIGHCLYGPKGACPDSLPYRCSACVEQLEAKGEAA